MSSADMAARADSSRGTEAPASKAEKSPSSNGLPERADGDDILRIQLVSAQIGALAKRQTSAAGIEDMYRVLNRRLHNEMRRAAKSPTVAQIVESLGDRSDFFVVCSSVKIFSPNLDLAHAQHEEIIDAIAEHDVERARKAMKHHIMTIEQRLETGFPNI